MKTKNDLFGQIKSSFLIVKDPIIQLISNFDDIKYIYSKEKKENKKIFYFYKDKIHLILDASQEILDFDKEDLSNIPDNLSELFYLSLLVFSSTCYDYNFSIENIEIIYKYAIQIENENKPYLKIIIWKIIYSLIKNFKSNNENSDEEIIKKEEECQNKFKANFDLLKLNLNLKYEYKEFNIKEKDVD